MFEPLIHTNNTLSITIKLERERERDKKRQRERGRLEAIPHPLISTNNPLHIINELVFLCVYKQSCTNIHPPTYI